MQDKLRLFDPTLPLDHARTIPRLWYTDPEIYAAECRSIFHSTWQAIGRADQVAAPGAFFTADVAGEPVVAVRGNEGTLRAFANVCRHRAARVMGEAQGQATRLRCRYHGWTYDLAGRLRGTPEFDGVADFRREDNGLVEYPVAVWGPLVFVHLGDKRPPLEEFIDPLPRRTASGGVEALRFVARREYDVACNWKVYVDNYLDGGYHINTVHPGLAGVLDYSQYGTDLARWTSVQHSPLVPAGDAVGQVRTGDRAYYWWVFPNFMLNLYQGVMDTNLVVPLGPDRCRVVFDFYFAAADEGFIRESIAVADKVQAEDMAICEEVQKGLGSRTYDAGRYSVRREAPVYHFHRLVAECLTA